ncbi:MAG: signal peptidase II [Firmicutes bacterium]|nr:signal peptidase II [Bacillota bacterium]
MITFALVIALTIALDLITKAVFTDANMSFIPGFLSIIYVENRGAAWSFLYGHVALLATVSIIMVAGLCTWYWWIRRSTIRDGKKLHWTFNIGIALLIGGAVGNLYDRIFHGHVRDFLSFDFVDFPIFNLADVFIISGIIGILLWVLFFDKRGKEAQNAA